MPSQDDVLASLSSAADAARQAYMSALAANPGADLGALYAQEMAVVNAWSAAEDKSFDGQAPGLSAAQSALDAETKKVRSNLERFKDVSMGLNALDNLVQAATSVAGFFA